VVHIALAREPAQRFADAGQMRAALAALRDVQRSGADSSTVALEGPSITQTRVAPFPLVDDGRASRTGLGSSVKTAVLAAAAALIIGLLAVAIGSGGDGGPGIGVTPSSTAVTAPPPEASEPGTAPMPLADALDRLEESVRP
jgi:hypothetical protein